jgi:hypothetical protein
MHKSYCLWVIHTKLSILELCKVGMDFFLTDAPRQAVVPAEKRLVSLYVIQKIDCAHSELRDISITRLQ